MKTREEEQKYASDCFDRYYHGGILWLIERTDKNEYLKRVFQMWDSSKPSTWHDNFSWDKSIGFETVWFLSKEDAEKELVNISRLEFLEDGCHCCGNGSKEIPHKITEHEFIKKVNPTINT